jgi:trehalose 6-phosphate synthase
MSFSPARSLRARLIVLSDRRPAANTSRSGLEAAIEWALHEHDGVWLAHRPESAPTAVVDAEPSAEAASAAGPDGAWSVLSGWPAEARAWRDAWAAYARTNASYAERIIELVSPDGTVWINGHRWLLVASALREYGHRGPIGLLLDVPFPAPRLLDALPWHAEVMAAIEGLDLLGLRSPTCADNFELCRTRRGRSGPQIEVFPDGLEAAARMDPSGWVTSFLHLLASAAVREPAAAFAG